MGTSILIEVIQSLGTLGVVFVIWYLTHLAEQRRFEQQRKDDQKEREAQAEKQDKDRKEHLAKWESMVAQQQTAMDHIARTHRDEVERLDRARREDFTNLFRQFGAQANAMSAIAVGIERLTNQIVTSQYCPLVRNGLVVLPDKEMPGGD